MAGTRRLLSQLLLSSLTGLQAGNGLSKAAIEGDLVKMSSCVHGGEKVTDVDKWGWTALHWAAYNRWSKSVKWLLERGADPNAPTTDAYDDFPAGTPPLIIAAAAGLDESVELLLGAGARREAKDSRGMTALDHAKRGEFPRIMAMLEGK